MYGDSGGSAAASSVSPGLWVVPEITRRSGPQPELVAVFGGQRGVGATTVAVHLAVTLTELGQRVVLVDADFQRSRATALCGLSPAEPAQATGSTQEGSAEMSAPGRGDPVDSVLDILHQRRGVHEVLCRGPGGLQIIPGVVSAAEDLQKPIQWSPLLDGLRDLGRYVETVILDVGEGSHPNARSAAANCDTVLAVTRPQTVSLFDTYASLKLLAAEGSPARFSAVVNQADEPALSGNRDDSKRNPSQGELMASRLAACCWHFLGRAVRPALVLPFDPGVGASLQPEEGGTFRHTAVRLNEAVSQLAARLFDRGLKPHVNRTAS